MDRSTRAARLADQIRDYLASWSQQDHPGYIFSLTQVTLTPDRSRATVWVQVSQPDQRDTVLAFLRKDASNYHRKLLKALAKQNAPLLTYKLDDSQALNKLFDQLLQS
ncbi:MAG: ribosome-binding factor A [bacterium]